MIIYHNNRCSKSRGALCTLQENGVEPTIINYLENPPTVDELKALLKKLKLKPIDIVRIGEDLFKTKFAKKKMNDEQILKMLSNNPILIERPIVVKGSKAIIARPPEKVLDLL